MDVTRRDRTSRPEKGQDNMIWLLGRLPKRPQRGGVSGEKKAGDNWDPAPVIPLARRRTSGSRPPLRFEALDGTTGLPLHLSDAEPCHSATGRGPLNSNRVLLVMPDEDMRSAAETLLSRRGYEVIVAATPLQAVWSLEHPPGATSAVVVAQRLQHTRGADLLAFLARRYPKLLRVLVAPASDCPANDMDNCVDQVISQGLSELDTLFPRRG